MEEKEFNLEKFIKEMGYCFGNEPYNYEKYKKINPKLSVRMYERMREGGCLYKIEKGYKHIVRYPFYEVLDNVWWRSGIIG